MEWGGIKRNGMELNAVEWNNGNQTEKNGMGEIEGKIVR